MGGRGRVSDGDIFKNLKLATAVDLRVYIIILEYSRRCVLGKSLNETPRDTTMPPAGIAAQFVYNSVRIAAPSFTAVYGSAIRLYSSTDIMQL